MSQCRSVHYYLGPRKGLHFLYCTNSRGHDGEHYDHQRSIAWEGLLLFWDEFEHTKVKSAGIKRKVKVCPSCSLPYKQGASFSGFCICQDVRPGENKRQGIMFAEAEREAFWKKENGFIDEFFEGWIVEIEAGLEPYFGEF